MFDTMPFQELRRGPLFATRAMALFSTIFGAAAIAVTAVGLYGVVSYSVARRTHEIGLRLAVGARRWDILRMVLRQGMLPTLIGTAIGLVGASVIGPMLEPQLFRVRPTDP